MDLLSKLSLRGGERASIGSWLTFSDPSVAEIMARAGFDWLVIDMEHSPLDINQAVQIIRVIDLCGCAPLVRTSDNDSVQIKRVMDGGARGVIVPMVNSREEASRVVEAVKYPPLGRRGVGLARAQGYGTRFQEYREWLPDHSIVIVQIEHIRGVENLEEILSVPGVDGFIIGPYDLSASLGAPGDFADPRFIAAMDKLRAAARTSMAGIHVVQPNPAEVTARLADGYRFIAYSVDFLLLGEAARKGMQELRPSL